METEDEAKAWSRVQQVVGSLVKENRELRYLAAYWSTGLLLGSVTLPLLRPVPRRACTSFGVSSDGHEGATG